MLRKKLFTSKTSQNWHSPPEPSIPDQLLQIQCTFNAVLNQQDLLKAPVKYIYNPTEYAQDPFEQFTKKYCQTRKQVLIVGMNPGPFGMCQTGVPFGDVNWVKNWLKIEGEVGKPSRECPQRPVKGYGNTHKEQSGDRFWKFWMDLCGSPEGFFRNSFVYNYCPLAFMGDNGRNLTPADIKDFKHIEPICDQFYLQVIHLLQPETIIAIGRYVEKRTSTLVKTPILFMPHPSPRALNNQNWPDKALQFIKSNNLLQYFQC